MWGFVCRTHRWASFGTKLQQPAGNERLLLSLTHFEKHLRTIPQIFAYFSTLTTNQIGNATSKHFPKHTHKHTVLRMCDCRFKQERVFAVEWEHLIVSAFMYGN